MGTLVNISDILMINRDKKNTITTLPYLLAATSVLPGNLQ